MPQYFFTEAAVVRSVGRGGFPIGEKRKWPIFEAEIGIQCMQRKRNLGKFQGGNRKQTLEAVAEIDFA